MRKVLQDDDLCFTEALETSLKTNKNMRTGEQQILMISSQLKVTIRIQDTDDGTTYMYQGVQITWLFSDLKRIN